MNIEYLDTVMSVTFTLRKIKKLIIQQEKNYNLRPQVHPMIVSPFGTGKSSLLKPFQNKYKNDIIMRDDITKPAIQGSVSKDGEYIPSILMKLGGKVLIIDEWNNLNYYARGALLSVLENQRTERTLGFKVKQKYTYNDEYTDFVIEENNIRIKTIFSCISFAMEYPIQEDMQKTKALLSRFSPLFIEPTKEYIEALTSGKFKITIEDYSGNIKVVIITKETARDIHTQYFKYINKHNLYPDENDEYGYISRIFSEIIRYGVFNYLKQNKKERKKEKIIIDDAFYFFQMFDYIHTLILQFTNPKTFGKFEQYKQLLKMFPNENISFYAKKLGVTIPTIYAYNKKIEFK